MALHILHVARVSGAPWLEELNKRFQEPGQLPSYKDIYYHSLQNEGGWIINLENGADAAKKGIFSTGPRIANGSFWKSSNRSARYYAKTEQAACHM